MLEVGAMVSGTLGIWLTECIETLRMIFGPISSQVCLFQCYVRNGPTMSLLLFIDAIAIFRVSYFET